MKNIHTSDNKKMAYTINKMIICVILLFLLLLANFYRVFFLNNFSKPIAVFNISCGIVISVIEIFLFKKIFKTITKMDRINQYYLIIERLCPNFGIYKYQKKDKHAHVSSSIFIMLNLPLNEKLSDKITEEEYFKIINFITKNPVKGENNIFSIINEEDEIWIKLETYEEDGEIFGVIHDVSPYMREKITLSSYYDYDIVTKLLSRDAFIKRIKTIKTKGISNACLLILQLNGIEDIKNIFGKEQSDRYTEIFSSVLKQFDTHNILNGRKSDNEFYVFYYEIEKDEIVNLIHQMTESLLNCVKDTSYNLKIPLSFNSGYSWYPNQANSIHSLLSNSDFALYEAITLNEIVKEFSIDNYTEKEIAYKKSQAFNKLIKDNTFDYHFQPIINAKNGEIFAYEALMRPISDIKLTPYDVLNLAKEQGKLYDIEKLTFYNTIKLLSENQDIFHNKKLFINSISDYILNDKDFDWLYETYGELFEKLVIEITENTDLDDLTLSIMHERYSRVKCQLALDDYGSGYSNESNLLKSSPNYIKIDRSLIMDINKDLKKQHLVSNIIGFAQKNNIKTLAEGIETEEELITVISLNIDLIQGFYTSKPKPILLIGLSKEIIDTIIKINLNKPTNVDLRKHYEAGIETQIDLVELALNGFTDIIITQDNVTLFSDIRRVVNMNIKIADNVSTNITISNINIRGIGITAITLGENSNVKLNVSDKNILSYEGIRVPCTSSITMVGDGDLTIDCDHNNSVALGGNSEQSYGNITLMSSGNLFINTIGDSCVGIGGGNNKANSEIKIISGNIDLKIAGMKSVGIGTLNELAKIFLDKCYINIKNSGLSAVGIGSNNGCLILDSNANIKITTNGNFIAAIGCLNDGSGDISINNGNIDISFAARNGVGIGGINSNINTRILEGEINIHGEGGEIVGIGDYSGSGNISISSGIISADLLAKEALFIGTKSGKVIISGGNINIPFNVNLSPENIKGEKLTLRQLDINTDYHKDIYNQNGLYQYHYSAKCSNKSKCINVYLPEYVDEFELQNQN